MGAGRHSPTLALQHCQGRNVHGMHQAADRGQLMASADASVGAAAVAHPSSALESVSACSFEMAMQASAGRRESIQAASCPWCRFGWTRSARGVGRGAGAFTYLLHVADRTWKGTCCWKQAASATWSCFHWSSWLTHTASAKCVSYLCRSESLLPVREIGGTAVS